jgi:hypothetical protein
MVTLRKFLFVAFFLSIVSACGKKEFEKNPVDKMIVQLDKEKTYSIILFDMDIEEKGFSEHYKHKYKIITQKDSIPQEQITDWYEVSEAFFAKHQNDLGMELVAKTADGKVSKVASPPGYSNYVGNPQYGHWTTGSDGNSFWEFYGKYAMMSSMLGLASSMINRNHYYDYRDNYWGRQPYYGYYGGSSTPLYGTMSDHSKSISPSFHQRATTSNSFKNKIMERVSRSSNSSRVGTGSSSSSSSRGSSSWFSRESNSSSSGSSGRSSSGGRSSGRSRRR